MEVFLCVELEPSTMLCSGLPETKLQIQGAEGTRGVAVLLVTVPSFDFGDAE